MKKRVLAAMMAAAVLFSACGQSESQKGSSSAAEEKQAEKTVTEFLPGQCTDDEFVSEFDELRFTLPEGWLFASDEELMDLMDMVLESEIIKDRGKLAKEIARQTTVYEMMATDLTTGTNVLITNEDTKKSSPIIRLDEEKYAEVMTANMSKMSTMEYVFEEPYWTDLAGKKYLVVRAKVPSEKLLQDYYIRAIGSRMLGICISRLSNTPDEVMDEILGCFSDSNQPAPAREPKEITKMSYEGAGGGIPDGPRKQVGSEEFGYVEIPETWVKFYDVEGGEQLQFSDLPGLNIITLNQLDLSEMPEEEKSQATLDTVSMGVWRSIETMGGQDVEGSRVKLGGYDAVQLYSAFNDGVYLVAWVFQPEDGVYRYVSAEGPSETVMDMVAIVEETYSLTK